MNPERRQWVSNARTVAKKLLQGLYEEYASRDDEKAAAIVEEIMARFESQFFIRRNAASATDDQILTLHEQGMSVREIAEQLNTVYTKVHYRMTRVLGLTPHHKYIRRVAPDDSPERHEVDQALLDMYKSGLSTGDIAAGSDLSRQRVHQRIKRALGNDSLIEVRRQRQRHDVFSIAEDTDFIMKKRNMKKVDEDD